MSEKQYQDGSVIHLISDILDKLIDTQSATAQSLAQIRESLSTTAKLTEEINKHFHNGFRSEIKDHVSDKVEELSAQIQDIIAILAQRVELVEKKQQTIILGAAENFREVTRQVKETLEQNKKLAETLEKPWHWIKIIGGILGSIAVIVGGIVTLYQALGD